MKFRLFSLFYASLCLALASTLGPLLSAQETAPVVAPVPGEAANPAPDVERESESIEATAAHAESSPDEMLASEEVGKHQTSTAETPEAPESAQNELSENEAKDTPLRSLDEEGGRDHGRHRSRNNNPRIGFGQDSSLAEGERADVVISILGSSTSAGEVHDAVVSILGSSEINGGSVGDAVVSILGSTRVNRGTVGNAAVAVLGNTYINGHVRGQVVSVLGNVELGPDAVVDGELVCIGGEIKRDPGAIVHGEVQNVGIGGHFKGLKAWISKCLLYGRPLAFGENLMWAWWIALGYLAFYMMLALVTPGTVTKCAQTLEERPGKSILAALLALLLTPVAYLLLTLTIFIVIGIALIPLFSLGLFFAGLFGKAVMLAWLGRRVTKVFGAGPESPPVLAVVIGGAIVLALYTVPVVGFIVYKLLGFLGLGVVIYTLLLSIKSNRPEAPKTVPATPPPAVSPGEVGELGVAPYVPVPPVISSATLPRAGFGIRLCAALLDAILIGIVVGMLGGVLSWFIHATGSFPMWFAAYNVIMWGTKGTTIGGIICGLKVVRVDDRPLSWSVAIVRGLGAFLSLAVAGLGFIWVAFDDDKQSWHDKIAGTTIVRVPKGTPLL